MNKYDVIVPCQPPLRSPCPIAFVGEAPGDEEVNHYVWDTDNAGRRYRRFNPQPFVGPAGRLFNSILRASNIAREDCLITNVFDQKAPDNECGPWMDDVDRVKASSDRLRREIDTYRPRVVVPLGGTPLWAFTGFRSIGDFRGAVMKASRIVPGQKLLPTFHPSHLFHSWNSLPVVTGDFIKAKIESKTPKVIYPNVTLLIEPSLAEIEQFLRDATGSPLCATDIETGWGMITNVGFAPTPNLAMNVPFVDLRKPSKSYWSDVEYETRAWILIKAFLEGPTAKVLQNGLYDVMRLWVEMHIAIRNYLHDTRLIHHVRFPDMKKDLGTMAANYTRLGAWKHWGHGGSKEKKDA